MSEEFNKAAKVPGVKLTHEEIDGQKLLNMVRDLELYLARHTEGPAQAFTVLSFMRDRLMKLYGFQAVSIEAHDVGRKPQ